MKEEDDEKTECIQCGVCVNSCPKQVLSYGIIERGKENGNRKED